MTLLLKRIINRLLRPYGINPFPRAFENIAVAESVDLTERFNRIYAENYWKSDDSHSGVGSELAFARRYGKQLAALIRARGLNSMFDAPCGDLRWMKGVLDEVDISYTGGDVSASLIEAIAPHHHELTLRHFDLTRDAFPQAELWHCRDCMFHLSYADLLSVFENALRSQCRFALLTTHKARLMHRNLDVGSGGFRMLDLERAPFNLPKPEVYLTDYTGSDFPRYVGLWKIETLEIAVKGLRDVVGQQETAAAA